MQIAVNLSPISADINYIKLMEPVDNF